MCIRDSINTLYEQGIPVVTLNTDIENSRRLAYVGSNYTRSGATAAGLLQLMTSGTVNIGIVTGSSNILCHTERIAGFMKTLVPYRDRIHVIDTVEIHDDEVESYEKMCIRDRNLSVFPVISIVESIYAALQKSNIFFSSTIFLNAGLAQLVEQLTCNQ